MLVKILIACVAFGIVMSTEVKDTPKKAKIDYNQSGHDWEDGHCEMGERQTPIHISSTDSFIETDSEAYGRLYDMLDTTLEYHHHMLQADYTKGEFHLRHINGETHWKSLQFHFHSPSEHHIDHTQYDLELHVVFQNEQEPGRLLVTGIFFQRDPELKERNEFLDTLNIDEVQEGINRRDVKIGGIYQKFIGKKVYNYVGSLTTPPCTEGVEWIVFADPIKVPSAQLKRFMEIWTYNKEFAKGRGTNRALQDRNDRDIYVFNYGKGVKTEVDQEDL